MQKTTRGDGASPDEREFIFGRLHRGLSISEIRIEWAEADRIRRGKAFLITEKRSSKRRKRYFGIQDKEI